MVAPQTYIGEPTQYYGMARRPDYSAITGAQSGLPLYALKQQEEEEAAAAARHKAEMGLAEENIEINKQSLADLNKYRQQGLDVSAEEMRLYKEIADAQRTSTKAIADRELEQQAAEAKKAQFIGGLQTGLSTLGTGYQIYDKFFGKPTPPTPTGTGVDTVFTSGGAPGMSGPSGAGWTGGGGVPAALGAGGAPSVAGAVPYIGSVGTGGAGGLMAAGTPGSVSATGAGWTGGGGVAGMSTTPAAAGAGAGMSAVGALGAVGAAAGLSYYAPTILDWAGPVLDWFTGGDDKGYTPEEYAHWLASGGEEAKAAAAPYMAYNLFPGGSTLGYTQEALDSRAQAALDGPQPVLGGPARASATAAATPAMAYNVNPDMSSSVLW